MPRRNPYKRTFKLIAFKAHHDCDQDILDWWESIEDGERSNVIRDVLREHLGHHPQPRRNRVIELNELMAMRQDTHWIRDALNDMPAYLERVMQQLAEASATVNLYQNGSRASPSAAVSAMQIEPTLSDEERQRRTRRMKQASW